MADDGGAELPPEKAPFIGFRAGLAELLKSAQASPRPGLEAFPCQPVTEQEHTALKFAQWSMASISSKVSFSPNVAIWLVDAIVALAFEHGVFRFEREKTKRLQAATVDLMEAVNGQGAWPDASVGSDGSPNLIKFMWRGNQLKPISTEMFDSFVRKIVMAPDVDLVEVTGQGDEAGSFAVDGTLAYIHR